MTDFRASAQAVPIESVDQLVEQFHRAGKPRERWMIGTEYEKVAVERASGRAAPFSGPRGIEAVLRGLAERYGWEPKEEDGRVVALAREGASITLEPGAQLELSGEQCPTIHCTQAELATHVREVVSVGGELGIAFLGLGMQPMSPLDEIEWVPKQRYRIMGPYMTRVGTLGQRMMKQTATDRGDRCPVPPLPGRGRRRGARHARRLEPALDHALSRGAAQGLHRDPLRRQPAARAHARAARAGEGRVLHPGLPRGGLGPGQTLELRGARRALGGRAPRGAARALQGRQGDRARARALRHRRGGAPPPAGARPRRP